ncbi:MAG: hypothetical protein ACRD9S_23375 [Pyrinomonadaceae bacterium]
MSLKQVDLLTASPHGKQRRCDPGSASADYRNRFRRLYFETIIPLVQKGTDQADGAVLLRYRGHALLETRIEKIFPWTNAHSRNGICGRKLSTVAR